jgi:nucleoside-diphosphate-sugar epimerase
MDGRRNVLVTGATGFIGGELVQGLLDKTDSNIVVLGRPISNVEKFKNQPRVTVVQSEWTLGECQKLVRDFRPTATFHVATNFLSAHKPEDVPGLLDANVRFPSLLLEALSELDESLFVNVGTAWQHWHADGYRPVCLYAATKQSFQDILDFYVTTNKFAAVTLKLGDVYGPSDTRNKIMNHLIKSAYEGNPLSLSPGDQKLDYVHVSDVVRAFIMILAAPPKLGLHEVYSLSSGTPISLKDLAALIAKTSGRSLNVDFGGRPYRDREVMKPWMGPQLPGWGPAVSLEQGMKDMLKGRV